MGVKLVLSPETAEKDLHVNQWEPYDLPHNEEGLVVVNGKVITARIQFVICLPIWIKTD